MPFKKLNGFTFFDFAKFWNGKVGKCSGIEPWRDFETKRVLGTKVEITIVKDETPYPQKDGEHVTNLYKAFWVKVPKMDLDLPIGSVVRIVNPVATVYGEYRNQLSVKADDVVAINTQTQGGK